MKKVLVIVPYSYLPYYSGGQKFIAQFLHYFGEETDLTVISVPGNDLDLAKTYKTISLLKPSFSRYFDFSLVKKISALVKQEGFDTVIWEHPYYAWLASRVRKRTGIKTIIHSHNIEYQRFRSIGKWWWPVLKRYEKRCFKKADALLFITPEDKDFAVSQWHIPASKCFDLPFGIRINEYPADRTACRQEILRQHDIPTAERILLFNGALDYKPNLDALKIILDSINPLLLSESSFRYKIIVCGKGLPEEMQELKTYAAKNIIYAGFVDDIDIYFKASDILLNPIQAGGGIKTKMVEAIGFGATVVATATGATGIKKETCGDKLIVVADNDWKEFTKAIIKAADSLAITPPSYYKYYYWKDIIRNLMSSLTDQFAGKSKKD